MKQFSGQLFLLLTVIAAFSAHAEIDIKVYHEKSKKGFKVFANNNEFCPISIKVNFTLTNMESEKGDGKVFVIPARATKFEITSLKPIRKGKYKFSYKTRYNYGNHYLTVYSKDYKYSLPFETGKSFKVSQGYNGSISHQEENALDFAMGIGTNITAARDGIVVRVVDTNDTTCPEKECAKFNNFVQIYHSDGTFAEYTHIKRGGAKVKIGDEIKKGELIAESGNIGRSTGPHLHFVVFIQKLGERRTLKTKFLTSHEKKLEVLKQGSSYLRD